MALPQAVSHPQKARYEESGKAVDIATEFARYFRDQLRIADGRRVKTDLLRARLNEANRFIEGSNATAYGEGHKDLLRHTPHHIERNITPFVTRGDVEKHKLIGAVSFVAASNFDRIAGVPQLQEMNSFDDPPTIDVEARNDPFAQHGKQIRRAKP